MMTIERALAQMTVTELDTAVEWYTKLFLRPPDARPMDGLVEWHLADTFGVQVWVEPDRAGCSSMVLDESDLDVLVAQIDRAGLERNGPKAATSSRILQLLDPDGNRVVFTGSFST